MKMMSKLIFAILVATISLFAQVNAGTTLEVSDDGHVRPANNQWHKATVLEQEAYENPGKPIFLYNNITYERVDLFHSIEVKKASKAFIYDGERVKTISKTSVIRSEPKFLVYRVLTLVAMAFMTVSILSIILLRNRMVAALAAAVAAVAVAAVAAVAVTALTALAAFAAAFASIAALTAALTAAENKLKVYWLCSVFSCIAGTTALFV